MCNGNTTQYLYLVSFRELITLDAQQDQCCVTVTHVLVKKIEKVPKVTLYAYLFKPNPPNSAK